MVDFGYNYSNHSGASLQALLEKLEHDKISPGRIIAIIDTGEQGANRWKAATWNRA